MRKHLIFCPTQSATIVEQEPQLVERLQQNANFFRQGLQKLGFNTLTSQTHIIPILVGDAEKTVEMGKQLLHHGVFAVPIRPPTVPMGFSRIRASLMATHTEADLAHALNAFALAGKQCGLI